MKSFFQKRICVKLDLTFYGFDHEITGNKVYSSSFNCCPSLAIRNFYFCFQFANNCVGNPLTFPFRVLLCQQYCCQQCCCIELGGENIMKKRLKQAHGNWVEGNRFWDRESDTELLINKLDEGAHILLMAQRRMGKTSLMKEIKRQLDDRYTCLFVDLQKASSAEDAIVEISLVLNPFKSLWNKTKGIFSNVLNKFAESVEGVSLGEIGIKLRAGLTSGNWVEKGGFSVFNSCGVGNAGFAAD